MNDNDSQVHHAPDKKRSRIHNTSDDSLGKESPIVFLNVGGAKRNIRRSLLNELRNASRNNPLCDVLLSHHWSEVPTIVDDNGIIRAYLDRNPRAFDHLLEYIEYGKVFLEEIITGNQSSASSARLKRLRLEAGYFTIDSLSEDIDDVMFGEPVNFSSGDWVSIAGRRTQNEASEVVGWDWNMFSGNTSLASKPDENQLSMLEVQSSGTYLVFFSLHSVAVTALSPSHGYLGEGDDEFCQLSVFHETMTRSEGGQWTYPLMRAGAFDYRSDTEIRRTRPLLFTASSVEPIELRKGNLLYCKHGTGVETDRGQRINQVVGEHTWFQNDPQCVNFITLVQISGGGSSGIAKWNVMHSERVNDEPTIAKWKPCINTPNNPTTSCFSHLTNDTNDDTKIQFKKEGYYLLLGRVASRLRKDYDFQNDKPAVQLELCAKGGTPLHINPEVVTYTCYNDDEPYNKKMVDYGHMNDIIYAEENSTLCVRALRGACFAWHGSVPVSFGRIPTQSLSAMRLSPSCRVDRYQISLNNYEMCFERALGGIKERSLLDQEQRRLFTVCGDGHSLRANEDCQCIVVGCLSSLAGHTAILAKNKDHQIIASQLCKESGYGSHSLSGIIVLEKNDLVKLKCRGQHGVWGDSSPNCGHLAFVVI